MSHPEQTAAEYMRIANPWDKGTLTHLKEGYAHTYIAMLSTIFDDRAGEIEDDEMYSMMNAAIGALSQEGILCWPSIDGSTASPRDVCRILISEYGYLQSKHDEARPGRYLYCLTEKGMRIMDAINTLCMSSDDSLDGSSLMIGVFMEQLESLAADVSGSADAQLRYLNRRKEEIDQQISDIVQGKAEQKTDSDYVRTVRSLIALLQGMPASFKTLANGLAEIRLNCDDLFLSGRPFGEANNMIIDAEQSIFNDEKCGREFLRTIKEFCSDDDRHLTSSMKQVLRSPALKHRPGIKRNFQNSYLSVKNSMEGVFNELTKTQNVISGYLNYLGSKSFILERETILRVSEAAVIWSHTVPDSASVSMSILTPPVSEEVANRLHIKAWKPVIRTPPAALHVDTRTPPTVTAKEMGLYGESSPQTAARLLLEVGIRDSDGRVDVEHSWHLLPAELQRLAEAVALTCEALALGWEPGIGCLWNITWPDGGGAVYLAPSMHLDCATLEKIARS